MKRLSTNARLALRLEGWRSRLVQVLLLAGFMGLIGRCVWLQGFHSQFLQHKGEERYTRLLTIPASRGIIRDRNGEPLALSVPAESLWVSREDLELTASERAGLARDLGFSVAELNRKLNGESGFVYLKRQVAPATAHRIMENKWSGLFLEHGFHRTYPKGDEMAHLVGFTDSDDRGQEGVELAYQSQLQGLSGARRVIKDRAGHILEDVENIRSPRPGRDLVLSVDARIQHLAFRELRNAVLASHAKAGAVVVVDSRTGEVLALSNYPDYDPNDRRDLNGNELRNRAITDLYEPGSTMKPFTIAAGLEAGKITPETVIPTNGGVLMVGNRTIHDDEPAQSYTVTEVIEHSSNVGAARIALSLPAATLWNFYTDLGLGQKPHLGFPGEAGGRLRPYRDWKPIEQATMAFGNGLSVSLIQMARAYTVFANQGRIRPLSLLRLEGAPPPARAVFSPRTAAEVTAMLQRVVSPEGTAPAARVAGYQVAGKTGTAHKVANGHYVNRYVASFVGFAPVTAPRVVVAVMIDEPSGSRYYGGQVAAPAFSALTGEIMQLWGVPPDDPGAALYAGPSGTGGEHHT